ncbi:MAG: hypothetical protein KatS3mg087_1078 [Patescibacteria group bacterium]|nr:MAG: hypothetical protein KatS3mg087_1078 [Patescibacteria group bacterium]
MTESLEAPVVGAKVLRISDRGYLQSPAVATGEWPVSPRGYRSPRGFFFWAFPRILLDCAYPLSVGYAVAVIRVLPHDTPGLRTITPTVPVRWPHYAPTVPRDADCVVARNMVGIARAVRIEQVIVREYDATVSGQHLREYGVPVQTPTRQEVTLGVDTDSWFLDIASVPVACGDYYTCGRPTREYADLVREDPTALRTVPHLWYGWQDSPCAARGVLDAAVAQVRTILRR